jgi:uncharacterized protein YcnI
MRVERRGTAGFVLAVEPGRDRLSESFASHAVIVGLSLGKVPAGVQRHGGNFRMSSFDYYAVVTQSMEGAFSIMRRTNLVRAGIGLAVAAVAVLGFAAPASAHVTVNPNTATQGGYTKVAFRVPDEKDTANTVKVEVTMPEDNPIASVSLKPVAGWTAVADRTKLKSPIKSDDGDITEAITKVTWTADPSAVIKPGQFQEFELSLGPLPKVDQVVFKALQYYSDGEVVRWIEEPAAGGDEPEHPAPVLKLTAAAPTTATPTTAAANTGTTTGATGSAGSDDDSGNGLAVGLGVAGLVAGLAGLILGLLAFRKASARTAA